MGSGIEIIEFALELIHISRTYHFVYQIFDSHLYCRYMFLFSCRGLRLSSRVEVEFMC
jgi:hypothetical protein